MNAIQGQKLNEWLMEEIPQGETYHLAAEQLEAWFGLQLQDMMDFVSRARAKFPGYFVKFTKTGSPDESTGFFTFRRPR